MTFSIDNQIEKKPLDQTFGSNPLRSGIDRTENDPLFDRAGNIGYGSDEHELPTVRSVESVTPPQKMESVNT
jgi:hypothetical protein